jgi:uncharacterized protein with PIN domain
MPTYQISVTRTTVYEVEAEHSEAAIDAMMEDKAKEVDGTTTEMIAQRLCPDCDEPLTDRTTRTVIDDSTDDDPKTWEEPTYCDTCDREVSEDEPEAQP